MRRSLSGLNLAMQQTPSMMRSMGNVMGYELMQLSNVMTTSKGRDKICALIQYTAELYYNCMGYSQEYHEQVV